MKRIILIVLFVAAAFIALAQPPMQQQVPEKPSYKHFGGNLHFGISQTTLDFTNSAVTTHSGSGWTLGGNFSYRANRWLGLRVGCAYVQSTSEYPVEGQLFSKRHTFSLNSLEAPLEITFSMIDDDVPIGGYLALGAYYSHIFKGGVDERPDELQLKPDQAGIQMSAGFIFSHLMLELNMRSSLESIFSNTSDPETLLYQYGILVGWNF